MNMAFFDLFSVYLEKLGLNLCLFSGDLGLSRPISQVLPEYGRRNVTPSIHPHDRQITH